MEDRSDYFLRTTLKIALIVFGISIILFFIIMPYPFTVSGFVNPIINVKSNNIEKISLGPLKSISVESNLFEKAETITDRQIIADICAQLNIAKKYHASNSRRKWYCRVALSKKNQEYIFTVRRTFTDGTLIYIGSRGEWGYDAIYRSDKLGILIESIAKRNYSNG